MQDRECSLRQVGRQRGESSHGDRRQREVSRGPGASWGRVTLAGLSSQYSGRRKDQEGQKVTLSHLVSWSQVWAPQND